MHPFKMLSEYGPLLLEGAWLTIQLSGLALLIGALLAMPMSVARCSPRAWLSVPVRIYISFFRGTPMLAQLFLVYFGAGQFRHELQAVDLWWLFRDPFYCALLTFVLNTTAYQAELLRGGILGVPRGEVEAARAYGMSAWLRYRLIVMPHAYRIAFPALGNEVILLLKGSAIASVVTLFDLMGQTRAIFAKSFDFSIYLWAALLYLLITMVIVRIWRYLEKRINPHLQRRVIQAPKAVKTAVTATE
ncbi:amino acid ABC transporter permease [Marinobacterium nitratireducens]|uniref:Arginine ABC transporter permease protein ArtM n=1 Tax=Marinobacterium nitratireducens TaxID=518897 RepID=A0A917ZR51_9GAMM|nr:ABC transporter permease subunit [Marinobacterium nitratireducens]GGO89512.1 amino acid ABC transporter permease [Marinobacterium nitratireducens]